MYCHECTRDFVASFDYDIDGNHIVFCPTCGHEHCRVIVDGIVTGERFDSRNAGPGDVVSSRRVIAFEASSPSSNTKKVSAFLRDRWLNRSDTNGD